MALFLCRQCRVLDLLPAATSMAVVNCSLRALTAALRVNLPKDRTVTLSNWEANPLTDEQVQYAAWDAWASLEVGRRLLCSLPEHVQEGELVPETSNDMFLSDSLRGHVTPASVAFERLTAEGELALNYVQQ
jgi:3'-5' exonuclease